LLFDDYLACEAFAPCGMERTRYHEYDRLPANCANVYIRDESGEYYTNIYSSGAKGTGDGGAFTTAGDVERYGASPLRTALFLITASEPYQNMNRSKKANKQAAYLLISNSG
jgi:CubicO group peptidase (beta-lactamase class C family)